MAILVGKKAPEFTAKAVIAGKITEGFSLARYLNKQYVVLFFYPKDFTFVCPTELHAFQEHLSEFESRGTAVVGCSTDSEFCHWAWAHTPKIKGGIEGVTYPLVADLNKTIASAYGVLTGEYDYDENGHLLAEGDLVARRALFLIDCAGTIQYQVVHHMPLGRSVKEVLRVVDSLQHFEQYGEVCPADWQKGMPAFKPTQEAMEAFFQKH